MIFPIKSLREEDLGELLSITRRVAPRVSPEERGVLLGLAERVERLDSEGNTIGALRQGNKIINRAKAHRIEGFEKWKMNGEVDGKPSK